jgi:hypothetical protein
VVETRQTDEVSVVFRIAPWLWRMAPASIDATTKAGMTSEVQVEEQSLGALPGTIPLRPCSVSIYSYAIQQPNLPRIR